jgi:uncharacterized membrane protein (DUF106 family)
MAIIELIQNYPRISIIVLSLIITLLITIVNFFMVDRKRMKEIRDKQKKLREEMKSFKDNPEKMLEINKKMMEDMPEQLKHSFKPMLVTLVPLLILFSWLRTTYAETIIASTWIWWYIGASIVFSIILRKVFGLQ